LLWLATKRKRLYLENRRSHVINDAIRLLLSLGYSPRHSRKHCRNFSSVADPVPGSGSEISFYPDPRSPTHISISLATILWVKKSPSCLLNCSNLYQFKNEIIFNFVASGRDPEMDIIRIRDNHLGSATLNSSKGYSTTVIFTYDR